MEDLGKTESIEYTLQEARAHMVVALAGYLPEHPPLQDKCCTVELNIVLLPEGWGDGLGCWGGGGGGRGGNAKKH